MKFINLAIFALLATSTSAINPVRLNQLDKHLQMTVASQQKTLDDLKTKIDIVDKMAAKAVDEATVNAALNTLHGLYSPYSPMIAGWGSYMYPNGEPWNPDHSVPDMIAQEITDAHKQLGYIRGLEAKLKGKDPEDGTH